MSMSIGGNGGYIPKPSTLKVAGKMTDSNETNLVGNTNTSETTGEVPQKGKSTKSTVYAGYYYNKDGSMTLYGPIGSKQTDTTKTKLY